MKTENSVSNPTTSHSNTQGGGSGDWYKEGGFSYHEGDAADSRMRSAASKRGIAVTSRSRPLTPRDFEEFDVIVAMDAANKAAIARAKEHWISKGKLKVETSSEQGKGSEEEEEEEELRAKVVMMTDFLRNEKLVKLADGAVPDPYYGGDKGFETVLDLLEDACEGLLEELLA
jgi:protein-tyrosine phosphatase